MSTVPAARETAGFLQRLFIGRPLPTAAAPHQTIGKAVGLAVFASDALSSTAYATEEILFVLVLAGTGVLSLSIPIAGAIAVLLAIVTASYQQTIHAYPGGGGAYIVARDNLGEVPAQVAGAALLTDYILTVSVSIAAGVAQITSAYPEMFEHRIGIALVIILAMTVINLRGVKESGAAFSVPTYAFLLVAFLMLGVGFYQYITGNLGVVTGIEAGLHAATQPLTLFLILRAFSSGCAALTGVEAISNGITAFREPKSRNAAITLVWMSAILATMFLGITFLARQIDALPSHTETVISQLARTVHGSGSPLYLVTLGTTTLILIMAANTSYADFPRLAALQAADGFLPRQLTYRGSRLVFSYGILALGGLASLLLVAFRATTTALIPLYAIGVFLSFTLSQAGMAVRYGRIGRLKPGEQATTRSSTLHFDRHWRWKQVLSAFGALVTGVVMIIFAITKFAQGAWIVVFLIPALVLMFFAIHYHYTSVAAQLNITKQWSQAAVTRNRVIVPIGGVHLGAMQALRYARVLSDDITAVYVALDPAEAESIREKWFTWGNGVRLEVVDSPYRRLIEPLLEYIDQVLAVRQAHDAVTVVVPQFVPTRWWHHLLHMNTAFFLRLALINRRNVVVLDVPYHLD